MKKLIAFVILLLAILTSTGCKSAVAVTEETVTARVEDKNFEGASVTFVNVGRMTNQIHHPAEYHVIIEYEGRRYNFDNESIYNKYDIGDEIRVVKEVKEYSDGSYKTTIKLN